MRRYLPKSVNVVYGDLVLGGPPSAVEISSIVRSQPKEDLGAYMTRGKESISRSGIYVVAEVSDQICETEKCPCLYEVERRGGDDLGAVAIPEYHGTILDGESQGVASSRVFTHDVIHPPKNLMHVLKDSPIISELRVQWVVVAAHVVDILWATILLEFAYNADIVPFPSFGFGVISIGVEIEVFVWTRETFSVRQPPGPIRLVHVRHGGWWTVSCRDRALNLVYNRQHAIEYDSLVGAVHLGRRLVEVRPSEDCLRRL